MNFPKLIQQVINYLKLIRWFHELLAFFPFLSIYLILLYQWGLHGMAEPFPHAKYALTCANIMGVMITGFVLNDMIDRDVDAVNKPKTRLIGRSISYSSARLFFVITLVFNLILAAWLAIAYFEEWIYIILVAQTLSILYSTHFKRMPLVGNVVMAILSSGVPLSLFVVAGEEFNIIENDKITLLVMIYIIVPVGIIIPRELSLDISDMEGDEKGGCRTLPLVIGVEKSKLLVIAMLIVVIGGHFFVATLFSFLAPLYYVGIVLLGIYLWLFYKARSRLEYIKAGRLIWFELILMTFGSTLLCI